MPHHTNTTEHLRSSTDDGLQTLSANHNNFKVINALPQSIMKLFIEDVDLYETFAANYARYHHSCRNKYSDYNYNRVKRKRKKESDTGTENSSTSHLQERRSNRVSLSLEIYIVSFAQNLMPKKTLSQLVHTVNTLHLQQLGETWLNWALCLESYKHVIAALCWGLDI